jgi:hypothetical protein
LKNDLLSDSELEVLSRKKKKKEEGEKKREIKIIPEIYESVDKVVNSDLDEIAPLKKESDENVLRGLEQWKEFDYYDRNWWIKVMKIQDTFPSVFTQISIFLNLHPDNYYYSLECRPMISVIVMHHLNKQWNIEYRVKKSEQKFKHNYILDKSKQYEVVDIYTEISYGPGIQLICEF